MNNLCDTIVANAGSNILLERLMVIKTPVTFLLTDAGIDLEVQHIVMKKLCVNTIYWLGQYDLRLTKSIALTEGNISDASYLTYKNCPNLKDLDLSNNQISNTILNFIRHPKLARIDLSLNRLSYIQMTINGPLFHFLNLSHNALTDLFISISGNNPYSIDLSNNQLKDLSFIKSLSGKINYLDLSFNYIVEVGDLKQLALQNPLTIDLMNNSVVCDCINSQSLIWAKHQRHTILRDSCWPEPGSTCIPVTTESALQVLLKQLKNNTNRGVDSWDVFDDIDAISEE